MNNENKESKDITPNEVPATTGMSQKDIQETDWSLGSSDSDSIKYRTDPSS